MNINRLNYENYFLLYIDGELSASESKAVDSFAAENTDLADELNMLLQTKLPLENDVFANKDALLRTSSNHINAINFEEQFLLFVDGELTKQEEAETLHFVVNHPQYQEVFDGIMQTRLRGELMSFPNKEKLYRKEEKRRPIFYMQWQKITIAAAILGAIVLTGILIPSNQNIDSKSKTKPFENVNNSFAKTKEPIIDNSAKEASIAFEKPTKAIAASNNIIPTILENPDNSLVQTETLTSKEAQETIAVNSTATTTLPILNTEANLHTTIIAPVNNQTAQTSYAKPALYKELDTDDEKKSLYVGALEINKDKLRGLLRKASSIFKSRNKNEEEKTEISNSHSLE